MFPRSLRCKIVDNTTRAARDFAACIEGAAAGAGGSEGARAGCAESSVADIFAACDALRDGLRGLGVSTSD